jgi:hypothetical protein
MQISQKGLLFRLARKLKHYYLKTKSWVNQEIVADDPYDVDTLFPEEHDD